MIHPIDWNTPAKLLEGERVNQFGDGYRQVSGPVVAEGEVMTLLELARKLGDRGRHPLFIVSVAGGNPCTIPEIEQQFRNRGGHAS